jgi:hypothetical protein
MSSKRRRLRKPDPLARRAAVRRVCDALRRRCPALIPTDEKQLISLLNAVRHLESHPATAAKSGRPSRWPRANLLEVARELKALLVRETEGRISLSSFVGVYLRILHFPADVTAALEAGQLTLQEANILARLGAERLAVAPPQAKALRQQILTAHLQTNASQNGLRARVQNVLGEDAAVVSTGTMAEAVHKVDELLEIDPDDTRHLFFEEIRNLFYALKEIEPEEVTEADLERFSAAADQVFNVLQAIRARRKRPAVPRPFQL